ncbi:MAG: hypothetical protein ACTSYC_11405 [Promethearchaeota archaeon]
MTVLNEPDIINEEFKSLFIKIKNAERLDRNERLYLLKKTQDLLLKCYGLNPQQKMNYCSAQRQLMKICLRSLLK